MDLEVHEGEKDFVIVIRIRIRSFRCEFPHKQRSYGTQKSFNPSVCVSHLLQPSGNLNHHSVTTEEISVFISWIIPFKRSIE
jgi:hypothetical protein